MKVESTKQPIQQDALLSQNCLLCEESLAELFKSDMLLEMRKNSHKGSILDFKDFEGIITELEYHKAKLFMAIRVKNKGAIREYLADTANFLLAIGNLYDVYANEYPVDECFEINKDVEIFKIVKVANSQRGEIIGQ
jgi:hypothetical protein